jgi:hypothetical protein
MKKLIYLFVAVTILASAACKKDKAGNNCNLPSTAVPANVAGAWVNGYTSFTNVIDAYNGKILGNTWQSGRYLSMSGDGKSAELYIMGGSMYSEFATQAKGTVTFNEADGSFQFHVCSAHYKGWNYGSLKVDRDATEQEKADMTQNLRFYYDFETSGGTTWLQLYFVDAPQASPTSFRRAN